MWPTPKANKTEGQYSSNNFSPTLAQMITGEDKPLTSQLNPDWVECLMGFPIGWTDTECDNPLPWPGSPAFMGQPQYDYESPRVATGIKNRAKRLKALGNAVYTLQPLPIFKAIAEIEYGRVV